MEAELSTEQKSSEQSQFSKKLSTSEVFTVI